MNVLAGLIFIESRIVLFLGWSKDIMPDVGSLPEDRIVILDAEM